MRSRLTLQSLLSQNDLSPWINRDDDNVDDAQLLSLPSKIDADNTILSVLIQKAAHRLMLSLQDEKNELFGTTPVQCFWVPGRIELVGKHTDYAGGQSLVCATNNNRGFAVVTTPRCDDQIHIVTELEGMEQTILLSLKEENILSTNNDMSSNWSIYPSTVVQRLKMNFPNEIQKGANIAVASNLPPASGMSSSSAIICYMFMVLDHYNSLRSKPRFQKYIPTDADLYTYLGNIENGQDYYLKHQTNLNKIDYDDFSYCLRGTCGVGTFGGSEDHTAIMSSQRNQLQLWQYCPTIRQQRIPFDDNVVFVICVSGARAEKARGANDKFNNASLMATWSAATYTLSLLTEHHQKQKAVTDLTSMETIQPSLFLLSLQKDYKNNPTQLLKYIFSNVLPLFNPNIPLLSEIICQEIINLGLGKINSQLVDDNDRYGLKDDYGSMKLHNIVVQSIQNRIRSMEPYFKEYVPLFFGLKDDDISCEFSIEDLVNRFQQFYYENEVIVPAVANAFETKNYKLVGEMVDWSHQQSITLLQNTLPETEWLPKWARGLVVETFDKQEDRVYALAASVFGAGFGGSCWSLVPIEKATKFLNQWKEAYELKFPSPASSSNSEKYLPREFFIMRPGQGAFSIGEMQ